MKLNSPGSRLAPMRGRLFLLALLAGLILFLLFAAPDVLFTSQSALPTPQPGAAKVQAKPVAPAPGQLAANPALSTPGEHSSITVSQTGPDATSGPSLAPARQVTRSENKLIGPSAPGTLAVPSLDDLVINYGYYDPWAPTPEAEKLPVYPGAVNAPVDPASTPVAERRRLFRAYEHNDSFSRLKVAGTLNSVLDFYDQALTNTGWHSYPDDTGLTGGSGTDGPALEVDSADEWWIQHSRYRQYTWEDLTGAFPYRRYMDLVVTEYQAGTITIEISLSRSQDLSYIGPYPGASGMHRRLETRTVKGKDFRYRDEFGVLDYAVQAEPRQIQDYYTSLLARYGYTATQKANGEVWFYYDYLGDRRLSLQLAAKYTGEGATRVALRIPTDLAPGSRIPADARER